MVRSPRRQVVPEPAGSTGAPRPLGRRRGNPPRPSPPSAEQPAPCFPRRGNFYHHNNRRPRGRGGRAGGRARRGCRPPPRRNARSHTCADFTVTKTHPGRLAAPLLPHPLLQLKAWHAPGASPRCPAPHAAVTPGRGTPASPGRRGRRCPPLPLRGNGAATRRERGLCHTQDGAESASWGSHSVLPPPWGRSAARSGSTREAAPSGTGSRCGRREGRSEGVRKRPSRQSSACATLNMAARPRQ